MCVQTKVVKITNNHHRANRAVVSRKAVRSPVLRNLVDLSQGSSNLETLNHTDQAIPPVHELVESSNLLTLTMLPNTSSTSSKVIRLRLSCANIGKRQGTVQTLTALLPMDERSCERNLTSILISRLCYVMTSWLKVTVLMARGALTDIAITQREPSSVITKYGKRIVNKMLWEGNLLVAVSLSTSISHETNVDYSVRG